MKRNFLSAVRLVLPVVFACFVLAIATRMFGAPSSTPAWAGMRTNAPGGTPAPAVRSAL